MTSLTDIVKELKTAIANGEELETIKERSGEWVEGYVPVYNNHIIAEWQEMPNDYDNRGALEFGYEGESDIIRLMMLDLHIYYTDLFFEAIAQLEKEGEE
jgi:hypothetical protein